MHPEYPITFGKYILMQRIAVGGMAEVFRAKLMGPKGFEKKLAIKRILPEYSQDEEFVQMFVDEARISSQLHHSHIVQVYDFGEVDHQFYLAMELIEGTNLKNLFFRCLKEHQVFPQHLIYYIVSKIASALDYAHHLKIEGQEHFLQLVHRDVSPQNVLISRRGEVKLTDFGIAKAAIKMTQTQPGKIQGKYSYMSPEQALGKPIDHRSDIFSLGIILFELLSGKKVYGSTDSVERYNQATKAKIPRLSRVAQDIPAEVDELAMRMLSADPKDRPPDCSEIVSTLSPFLHGYQDDQMMKELGEITRNLFPPPPELKASEEISATPWQEDTNARSNIQWKGSSLEQEEQKLKDKIADKIKEITLRESTITRWFQRRKKWFVGILLVSTLALFSPVIKNWTLETFSISKSGLDTKSDTEIDKSDPLPDRPEPKPRKPSPAEDSKPSPAQLEMELLTLENEIEEIESALTDATPQKTPPPKAPPVAKPQACPSNMVKITGGQFVSGSNVDDPSRQELLERDKQTVTVKTFCIDRYEYPNQKGKAPQTNVSWDQANKLCANQNKRLCTEQEWERACKGPHSEKQNQQFPYGTDFSAQTCNVGDRELLREGKTTLPISGQFNNCVTSEGVFDLSGSVHEWTKSPGILNQDLYMTKGGSFETTQYASRCSSIKESPLDKRSADLGFRCCK